MSNFPSDYDDDTTLPFVNDNITEIGAEAINALRDAVFNIEQNVGLNAQGSALSIANRLGISLNPDGTIKPSAIASLGLVTLPITEDQISPTANIPESKLHLDHRTQDLFNYIQDLSGDVNAALGWISITGSKLDPHLLGAIYRHTLDQIDISTNPSNYLKNKFRALRDNTNFYTLVSDINDELLAHQWADGSIFGTIQNVVTNDGSTYPSNYSHPASGIFLNTSRFSVIPQTAQDLQEFAEFIDSSSIFLYGTRIQNLYSNGISKISRSSSLSADGYGLPIIPPTTAIAYLLNDGSASAPVDDISTGDDIIEFKPSIAQMSSNSFDEKFALVKAGDIVRINYGTIEVQFIIKEKKYIQSGGNKKYIVRIAGKNLFYTTTASARIDRSLVNENKFGVLAIAAANNSFAQQPSLIVGNPSGAQALGIGFNPDQFDGTHYLLYLALYPTGHPEDGYTILPGIDVTGNSGSTPGSYTLESIVEATNNAFRQSGYNYRFIAFSYQGEFGIMLADSYNNAGFSVLSAVVAPNGSYDQAQTNIVFQNNVVGMFAAANSTAPDPLGFGPLKGAIASPPYMTVYGSPEAALNPTKLYLPLNRNNYYINGTEKDKLAIDVNQVLDGYGDGYWVATVTGQNVFPGTGGHIQTTYRVNADLSTSNLKAGKTLVVQSVGQGSLVDFGRFTIQTLAFGCSPNDFTDITVYDAVHATGFSPSSVLSIGSQVGLYFCSDSVSFNLESATDFTPVSPFKRYFEVYADENGKTFTHERARIYAGNNPSIVVNDTLLFGYSELNKLNIVRVSPKLRGYQFGTVNKITLNISNFDDTTGIYDGYLASYDGTNLTKCGTRVSGKKGEVTRFYDESNIDYIDIIFDMNLVVNNFTNQLIDFQLFPTLSLDPQIMLLASCQLNNITNVVSQLKDERQFGNTSEKDLTTSALNLISLPEKLLHSNGVIRGFELDSSAVNPNNGQIFLKGGLALVNGKIVQINNQTVTIPQIKELNGSLFNVNWAVCVNDKGEIQPIPLLDYDPTLGTPTNVNRQFKAYDVVSSKIYFIDAASFPDLVTKRKDLAVLYVASATVTTTPSITLSLKDARRFIYDETLGIPFTMVPSDSSIPGHFKSFEAAITWINKFGSDNNTIVIRGTYNLSSSVNLTNVLYPVTFKGENAVINISNSKGFLINQNVTFDGVTFNYNPLIFNNTGLVNGDAGCIFSDGYSNAGNVAVKNCTFNSGTSNHPPFICFNVNVEQYVDNVFISNNIFNDTNSVDDCAIAFISVFEGTSYTYMPTVANVTVSGNICKQSQSIFIAGAYDNILLVAEPGIAALNVKIINNSFGYIGYGVSSRSSFNSNVSGTHEHSLVIDGNTALAVVGTVGSKGQIISNPNYPTGEVVINNNQLNFIHTQWGQNTDGYSSLTISNNNLHARDYNSIMSIFGLLVPVAGGAAISVGFNTVYSTVTTVKTRIVNNNITTGKEGSTILYYRRGIEIAAPSIIDRNVINGLMDDADNTFGIVSPSSVVSQYIITNNIINRGSSNIACYISVGYLTTTGQITDNILDSSYTDTGNTNTDTIFGASAMLIERNINQILTTRARMIESGRVLFGDVDDIIYGAAGQTLGTNNLIVRAHPNDGYPGTFGNNSVEIDIKGDGLGKRVTWIVDLRSVVPRNAKIVELSINGTTTVTNQFTSASFSLALKKKDVYPNTDPSLFFLTYNFDTSNPGTDTSTLTGTNATNDRAESLYALVRAVGTASVDKFILLTALSIKYKY
jgi:hypothetical protein